MNEDIGVDEGGEDNVGSQDVDAPFADEASKYGWQGKEFYKGDPDKWVDAETFVKRGREINPILRKNNERLLNELKESKAQISEMQLSIKEFSEIYKGLNETAYKRAIDDVKAQMRAARQDGDLDLADDLSEQLDTLKEEAKNIKVPKVPEVKPDSSAGQQILMEWAGENSWYNEDQNPDLFYMADGIAIKLSKERPELVGKREFLDEISRRVKDRAPDRFKKRTSAADSSNVSSNSNSGLKGRRGYNDLPGDAKAACDRLTTKGKPGYIDGFTREKYVAQYFEQE